MRLTVDRKGRLKISEAQLQKACVELLRAAGWKVRPAPRLGHQQRGGAAYEVPKGEPDLLAVKAPSRILWAELKTLDGRVSPEQKSWHAAARKAGFEVVVVRSVDDLREVL